MLHVFRMWSISDYVLTLDNRLSDKNNIYDVLKEYEKVNGNTWFKKVSLSKNDLDISGIERLLLSLKDMPFDGIVFDLSGNPVSLLELHELFKKDDRFKGYFIQYDIDEVTLYFRSQNGGVLNNVYFYRMQDTPNIIDFRSSYKKNLKTVCEYLSSIPFIDEVVFWDCWIYIDTIKSLFKRPLKKLEMSNSGLDYAILNELNDNFTTNTLKYLDLSLNHFSAYDIDLLCRFLKSQPFLKEVNVKGSGVCGVS